MTTLPLTPRQLTACVLYAQGLVIREIAERTCYSWTTVNRDLTAAKKAMGAKTLGQLMAMLEREIQGVEVS